MSNRTGRMRKTRPPDTSRAGAPAPTPARWAVVLLCLVLFATAAIRLRLLDVPLERDEGEYAYAGQLLLQGVPPYQLAYNMKFPGTYVAYAVILGLFGQTVRAIHLGLLLVNAGAIMLVFLLARRLSGPLAGVASAATYALLSLGGPVLGFATHATHFVILAALGGVLLLLVGLDGRRGALVWSGVLFGVAILAKQPGVFFLAFGALYLLWRRWREGVLVSSGTARELGLLLGGAAIPLALTFAALGLAGVFDKFWFWTIRYAREYTTELTLGQGLVEFRNQFVPIVGAAPLLWLIAAGSLFGFLLRRGRPQAAPFFVGFLAFSFLAVCPGLYFRQHYFVVFLPAVALLVGQAVARSAEVWRGPGHPPWLAAVPSAVVAVALGSGLWQQRELLFELSPFQVSRAFYGSNPFPESPEIARYIAAHTSPADRIAVVGSEPQIYFYSQRRSGTGYIYTYGLVENQPYARRMQEEMIREIEAARPEFLVFVNIWTSWLIRRGAPDLVFEWVRAYGQAHYEVRGLVEILPTGESRSLWGDTAAGVTPATGAHIVIGRRKR